MHQKAGSESIRLSRILFLCATPSQRGQDACPEHGERHCQPRREQHAGSIIRALNEVSDQFDRWALDLGQHLYMLETHHSLFCNAQVAMRTVADKADDVEDKRSQQIQNL
jgi:hypothetical protein